MGGLHSFINWPRGMLTDSGGFQMVSLLHLADITEQGVTFQSPVDGSRMLLTPEESIAIQNNLGADIMMQLDDVVPATNTGAGCACMPWRQSLFDKLPPWVLNGPGGA